MAVAASALAEPRTCYELIVAVHGPLRTTIRAVGELDLTARDDLAHVLRQQEGAPSRVVQLDVSHVTFLDCTCLGVLVGAHHRLLELHELLVLAGVNAVVDRMLRATGLDGTLSVVPTGQDPLSNVMTARPA